MWTHFIQLACRILTWRLHWGLSTCITSIRRGLHKNLQSKYFLEFETGVWALCWYYYRAKKNYTDWIICFEVKQSIYFLPCLFFYFKVYQKRRRTKVEKKWVYLYPSIFQVNFQLSTLIETCAESIQFDAKTPFWQCYLYFAFVNKFYNFFKNNVLFFFFIPWLVYFIFFHLAPVY